MLLEVYILFQILAIIGAIMIFHSDTVFVSAVTLVVSSILAVGAWVLNLGSQFVWNPSIRAYVAETVTINTPYLAGFNMLIVGIALMYFFHDLFAIINNETKHIQNPRPQGGQQKNEL